MWKHWVGVGDRKPNSFELYEARLSFRLPSEYKEVTGQQRGDRKQAAAGPWRQWLQPYLMADTNWQSSGHIAKLDAGT